MKRSVVLLSLIAVACGGGPALAPVAPAVDVTVALAPVEGRGVVQNAREEHTGVLDEGDTIGDRGSAEDTYEFYASEGQMLRITMDSEEFDTFLRLRGPNGDVIALNDDRPGGGVNSQIDSRAPTTGRYTAVAGTYSQELGTYVIGIETIEGAPTTPPSTQQAFTLYPGFTPDPMMFTGTAGGTVSANQFAPDCRGWVASTPTHTMTLTAAFSYLAVIMNSPQDTTLVIERPDGTYLCDDDGGGGFNPFVSGAFQAGTYQIYAGTYAGGQSPTYRLAVTTQPNLRSQGI